MRFQRIGVYGVGHFGYALLRHLADKCERAIDEPFELLAYDRNDEVRQGLREHGRHPHYDTDKPTPACVTIVDDPETLLEALDLLLLCVTSDSAREVASEAARRLEGRPDPPAFLNTAKALDSRSGQPLSRVVLPLLAEAGVRPQYAALSGGTIAADMLRNQPLGATVACADADRREALRRLLSSPSLWIEPSDDVLGVELAGAFKNVISICAGMAEGMGFAYGVETHLISRLAGEIGGFCVEELGASPETFSISSQCWGNDMWMSCTGPTRNRELGRLIGSGRTLQEAIEEMTRRRQTVEGVATIHAMAPLFERFPDSLPLLRVARRVMLEHQSPQVLFEALTHA
jgi:glycerol-3-phosphate dehydrogenase (NAD(P)+)